jgi:hypothetical protein
MFTELKISNNPIEENDTNLRVLRTAGILDYCSSGDNKRFYIVSTVEHIHRPHFILAGQPAEKSFFVRYICKVDAPTRDNLGKITYPLPVDCESAGREIWFSLQTGAKINNGNLTIKSDKSGQITSLLDNNESRAFQLWARNPGRIKSFAEAMEYLGHVVKNEAKLAARPKSAGTSPKAITKMLREAEIEERVQAKLRKEVIAEME